MEQMQGDFKDTLMLFFAYLLQLVLVCFPAVRHHFFLNSFDVLLTICVFGTLFHGCIGQFLAKSALLFPAALSGPLCHYRYVNIYIYMYIYIYKS